MTTVSPSRRMHVLRDLCLITRSDGHTAPTERMVLIEMANGLEVSRDFVTQQLGAELEPD